MVQDSVARLVDEKVLPIQARRCYDIPDATTCQSSIRYVVSTGRGHDTATQQAFTPPPLPYSVHLPFRQTPSANSTSNPNTLKIHSFRVSPSAFISAISIQFRWRHYAAPRSAPPGTKNVTTPKNNDE